MIGKLLIGRVLPVGVAGALLASSASPLQPALRLFESAGNALGGDASVDTSDIQMPDEASVQQALGQGEQGIGAKLSRMFNNLLGKGDSGKAKAQLDQIIAKVKSRSDANAVPGAAANAPAGKQGPGKPGAKGGGGKPPPGKGAAKAPGKGAQPAPTPAPAAPSEPAAPPSDPSGAAASTGGGEGAE
jgi:hypothetical protein